MNHRAKIEEQRQLANIEHRLESQMVEIVFKSIAARSTHAPSSDKCAGENFTAPLSGRGVSANHDGIAANF